MFITYDEVKQVGFCIDVTPNWHEMSTDIQQYLETFLVVITWMCEAEGCHYSAQSSPSQQLFSPNDSSAEVEKPCYIICII